MKKIILSLLLMQIISLYASEDLLESCSLQDSISELSVDDLPNHVAPKQIYWDSFSFDLNKRNIESLTLRLQKAIDEDDQLTLCKFVRTGASDYIVQGYNVLHVAVLNASVDLTQLALKAGVRIDANNIYGCSEKNTALHLVSGHDDFRNYATERSNYKVENRLVIAKILLDAGANINALNRYGITPLSQAVSVRSVEMVAFFLKNGAKVDRHYSDYPQNFPLCKAVRLDNVPIVKLLLEYDADPYIIFNIEWPDIFIKDLEGASLEVKALVASYAKNLIPCTKEDARWHRVIARVDAWNR